MSRMFPGVRTWSPATGCTHGCPYCSARIRTLPRLKNNPKYAFGFDPVIHPRILQKGPPAAETIFLCYMGDLFCSGFSMKDIDSVIDRCMHVPRERVGSFLLMTKNPARYLEFLENCPDVAQDGRFIFGSTIETNRNLEYIPRTVPAPVDRLKALSELRNIYKSLRIAVSMEPILDFDPEMMGTELTSIGPETVWIGFDNYNLVPKELEPSWQKALNFMAHLRTIGINVIEKTIRKEFP